MEKITYQPLINHLSESPDFYNQLYREYEMNYGAINHALLTSWVVNIVEPMIKEVSICCPDNLPQTFKAFYKELLQILSNKSGVQYENEYHAAWQLCSKIPKLTATYPSRLLKAIDSALESLRTYQPEKVVQWIAMMDTTISNCKTIDEFLACGRIYAWMCGMAHLRVKAEAEYLNLGDELKDTIRRSSPAAKALAGAFRNDWPNLKQTEFVGEAGGFVGFGGPFTTPPVIALLENGFFASDKQKSCAFFVDSFGQVLLTEIPVTSQEIIKKASIKDLNIYKSQFGINKDTFNDITSFAVRNSTLVLTRASSHYLFVYGKPHDV